MGRREVSRAGLRLWWRVLQAVAELVDDAGEVPSAHITPSPDEPRSETWHCHEAGRRVLGVGCRGANGRWVEGGFVSGDMHRRAPGRVDGAAKEGFGRRQVARGREPAVQYLAIQINTAIQVVLCAQDLHVGLVHQPRADRPRTMPTNSIGQSWPELLDPA